MDITCGQNFSNTVEWLPQTEYMGNHILSSNKVRKYTGWSPKISLTQGIKMSYESILKSEGYNPLQFLEEAEERNIDLTEYF